MKGSLIGAIMMLWCLSATADDIIIKFYDPNAPQMTREKFEERLTTLGACRAVMVYQSNDDFYVMDNLAEGQIQRWTNKKDWEIVRKSYTDFKRRMTVRLERGLVPQPDIDKYEKFCDATVSLNAGAK